MLSTALAVAVTALLLTVSVFVVLSVQLDTAIQQEQDRSLRIAASILETSLPAAEVRMVGDSVTRVAPPAG